METSRRVLLKGGLVAAGVTFLPGMTGPPIDLRPTAAARVPFENPFSLGVASGDPSPDGFVLWTRLARLPLDDDASAGWAGPGSGWSGRWRQIPGSAESYGRGP